MRKAKGTLIVLALTYSQCTWIIEGCIKNAVTACSPKMLEQGMLTNMTCVHNDLDATLKIICRKELKPFCKKYFKHL